MAAPISDTLESIAKSLEERGWSVTDALLHRDSIDLLAAELLSLWEADAFREARVGAGEAEVRREDIRSNSLRWLSPESPTLTQRPYFEVMERLRLALNQRLFLGLLELECHYAVYKPGEFYERHLDSHEHSDARVVSTTLYLNDNWQERDGGHIRLYTGSETIDILPTVGTMAIFLSEKIPHEVLPATRNRLSLTGWFRRRSFTRIYP